MKKLAYWLITIASVFCLFLIYDFIIVAPTITIENIKLIEDESFKKNERSYTYNYAVNENESKRLAENNIKMKRALITFRYANQSFFKTIYGVEGQYATPENLPPIVVGKKTDMAALTPVNIYSKTHENIILKNLE